ALQLGVLVLKRLQPGCLGYLHAAILGLQLVERRRAKAMPAANLSRRHPGLLFFNHPDNLRLGETALSHSSAPSGLSRLYIMVREFVGGRSRTVTCSACPDATVSKSGI